MDQVKVGVVGYGTIGQRLADGVHLQGDMELVGVADVAPTLAIRALKEKGMPYALYLSMEDQRAEFDALGIPFPVRSPISFRSVTSCSTRPTRASARKTAFSMSSTAKRPSFRAARKTTWPTCSSMATPTLKRTSIGSF